MDPEKQKSEPSTKKDLQGIFYGFQFAITILAGLAVGYWIDRRFGTSPMGTLGGFFGGTVLAFYNLIRVMK